MSKRLAIMVVTQIPLWSMDKETGGPALSQMVFGYARAGHSVHLVTPELPYVSQADLPEGVVLHTFKHAFHGAFIGIKKVGWLFDAAGWLVFQRRAGKIGRRLLREQHFDVIYGYDVWGIPCARKLADSFRLPMVSRFQGTRMNRWIGARMGSLRFFKYFKAFRTPADLYIMTNDGSRGDRLLKRFQVDESRLRFWRNGVDIECAEEGASEARRRLGLEPGNEILLTLCRLVPEKGVQHAVRAMPEVLERFPTARLVVVGEGPYRAELESLASGLGISEQVLFTGGLDRKSVAAMLQAADVFVSMYDHSNVGNPLLEALSCGKAIVTSDVGATGEVITHGENGLLLPPDGLSRLGEVVCDLLSDNALRAKLGLGARGWAAANLTDWQERIDMEISEIARLVGEWQAVG
ncbi:MAG: glycosyltransferase family 1 protein [Actinobacteria bacterium]|nr:MAG: glycosyltransferase family 1 protein [Actinomycetota bacterium]